jgi:uncharacterized protein (TIGR02246 family)
MTSSNETHEAIVAASERLMTTFGRADAAGTAALFTERGQILPPNSDFLKGREAIQGLIQYLMDTGVKRLRFETVETEGYGDTASEMGKYTLEGEGGQAFDRGKYIVIWKQEEGAWMQHRCIFNSSMPAPGS